MKFTSFIKTSVIALGASLLLSGCVAYSNTDVKINNENNLDVVMILGFDKTGDKEQTSEQNKLLDEGFSKANSDNIKVSDYEDDSMVGRKYTLTNVTLADMENQISGLSGQITKTSKGYEGSFTVEALGKKNAVFSITAPGKIVTADNGAIIKDNKATWNLETDNTTTVHFQSENSNGIGLLITLLLLVVFIISILFGYKKREYLMGEYQKLTKKEV